ncbi:MAG: isopenicillin N synthase family oxygenase [Ferrovibrio sp.]|uniref:isopenicillin N synthase family dioxygenase n=1 Tax=Ferrovibrio sp. TaxID=1917215 RepID=UPI002622E94B|nr:2-oxoglutarate and iron-dependent oxygenase domain-containing protein [Ferrovibrio sp.]MCW0234301.1 isopenicillin N synthase family oxygenase [Ferrovibrio sp.]
MNRQSIPTVDISGFLNGSAADKAQVAAAIATANESIGFFALTGHGVPDSAYKSAYDAAYRFFDLSFDEKDLVKRPSPEASRGYNAVGRESLAYSLDVSAPFDLKETFAIGPVDLPADPDYAGPKSYPHFVPNIWPERPEDLRTAWISYFRTMHRLADDIMRIFAVALDLPESWFADKTDKCISLLRAQNYPDQPTPPQPGQLRAGAHSDYGALTILRGDDSPGGLQVRTRDGDWIDAAIPPGGFMINIGDLMAQWTNDRWVSTLHRVVNPPVDRRLGSRRLSIAFFHQPNYDAVIECIPGCQPDGGAARYAPITSGDHKRMKFAKANNVKIEAIAS